MTVFVDTAAWIALLNRRDTLHDRSRQIMDKLRLQGTPLVTTKFVILEVADGLCNPPTRSLTISYIDRLRNFKSLTIASAEPALLVEGWRLYSQRLDKAWSLTDCVSFVVMTEQQITRAFTSDRHFEQAGFVKLL